MNTQVLISFENTANMAIIHAGKGRFKAAHKVLNKLAAQVEKEEDQESKAAMKKILRKACDQVRRIAESRSETDEIFEGFGKIIGWTAVGVTAVVIGALMIEKMLKQE